MKYCLVHFLFSTVQQSPHAIIYHKKTGDFSPVMIQLSKIKPIHRFRLQCNHLQ